MNVLTFTLLVWVGSFVAGFIGAMTGLGGGVVLVPLLVLVFGVDVYYAIGASLTAVIATSCTASTPYLRLGLVNLRLALLLQIATTWGALLGASLVALTVLPADALCLLLGVVLVASAVLTARIDRDARKASRPDSLAVRLRLDGEMVKEGRPRPYYLRRIPLGWALMFVSGIISGLLGIGSGALNVVALDQVMRVPFKVATTTSTFMIGCTAAAGAWFYLCHGYIDPGLALPVVLGVLPGSVLGARAMLAARADRLRLMFCLVVLVLGAQMLWRGCDGLWRSL